MSPYCESPASGWIAAIAVMVCAHPAPARQRTPSKVVEYAPHVRIDWPDRRVEVDGEVVLRDGMLELFACSPHTREHESIAVVHAKPESVFEALGLLGLTPGHPVKYDDVADRWIPPSGETVRIDVRWTVASRTHTADIGTWMQSIATGKPVPPDVWRFAGSTRTKEGTFLADADGTVICVVDFASALIAMSELKTADNDALWVRARTDAIPPIGTPVTLLFSAVDPVVLELHVGLDGAISLDGKTLSMKRIVDRVRRFQTDHRSTRVTIRHHARTQRHIVERIADGLRRAVRPGTAVDTIEEPGEVDHSPQRTRSTIVPPA